MKHKWLRVYQAWNDRDDVIALAPVYEMRHLLIVVFQLRLHPAINRSDFVSWCMLYTYERGLQVITSDAFVRKWRCTFVGEPLNHIYQDTKNRLTSSAGIFISFGQEVRATRNAFFLGTATWASDPNNWHRSFLSKQLMEMPAERLEIDRFNRSV